MDFNNQTKTHFQREYKILANVLNDPKHDFTKKLIRSVPSLSLPIPSRKTSSNKKEILDFCLEFPSTL